MKIRLKRSATERLAACSIFPGDSWVLIDAADQCDEATICKVCKSMARSVSFQVASGS